jgi:hypothetical protein
LTIVYQKLCRRYSWIRERVAGKEEILINS